LFFVKILSYNFLISFANKFKSISFSSGLYGIPIPPPKSINSILMLHSFLISITKLKIILIGINNFYISNSLEAIII
jgi:hypothetical protein